MIFLTVGTVLPFDRLVKAVDEAVKAGLAGGEVFAQIGAGGYRPRHMDWVETLDRAAFEDYADRADRLVGHAGIGTIVAALGARKPLLVMPRRAELGEHVNDHQLYTAREFASRGHILSAGDESEIPLKLKALRSFIPVERNPRPEGIIERIKVFIDASGYPAG